MSDPPGRRDQLGRLHVTVCPRCAARVLHLPTSTGTQVVDVDLVAEDDPGAAFALRRNAPEPNLVGLLREHDCAVPPPVESITPSTRPLEASRSDFHALRELSTKATLLRAQETGKLRPHPGSRTHRAAVVPHRLLDLDLVSASRCVLCRSPVEPDDLLVATTDGVEATALRVHSPACPPRRNGPRMDPF